MKSRLLKITALSFVLSGCWSDSSASDSPQLTAAAAGLQRAIQSIWLAVPDTGMVETAGTLALEQTEPAATPAKPPATRATVARIARPLAKRSPEQPPAQPEPGDAMTVQITAQRLGLPITITQRVMKRDGDRLVVDQLIDDGFVEPLELRLRIDKSAEAGARLVSVARLDSGVQLPYGTAAYRELMTLVEPPVEHPEELESSSAAVLQVGHKVIDCERNAYFVSVEDEPATMTVLESTSLAWGNAGAEIRNAAGEVVYQAEVVALNRLDEHAWTMVAMNTGADHDYEVWAARIDEAHAAQQLALAAADTDYLNWEADGTTAETGARLALASAEADYEAWDGETTPWRTAVLSAPNYGSEADYDAWDAEAPAPSAGMVLASNAAEEDYEAWDAESGAAVGDGNLQLADIGEQAAAAVAARDEDEDYDAYEDE